MAEQCYQRKKFTEFIGCVRGRCFDYSSPVIEMFFCIGMSFSKFFQFAYVKQLHIKPIFREVDNASL